MSCILRISGQVLDLTKALSLVSFTPHDTHRKGDTMKRTNLPCEDSGFKVCVSDSSEDDLPQQCEDAEAFLRLHSGELRQIEAVDSSELDFGYDCRIGTGEGGKRIVFQCDYIPASLVKICGDLSIGIALTQFPPRKGGQ